MFGDEGRRMVVIALVGVIVVENLLELVAVVQGRHYQWDLQSDHYYGPSSLLSFAPDYLVTC